MYKAMIVIGIAFLIALAPIIYFGFIVFRAIVYVITNW